MRNQLHTIARCSCRISFQCKTPLQRLSTAFNSDDSHRQTGDFIWEVSYVAYVPYELLHSAHSKITFTYWLRTDYILITYGLHTDYMLLHTDCIQITYKLHILHTDYIQITYLLYRLHTDYIYYIQTIYRWHTNYICNILCTYCLHTGYMQYFVCYILITYDTIALHSNYICYIWITYELHCSSSCFGFAKQFEEPHLKCTILMGSNCIVMIVTFLIAKSAQQSIHHAIYGPVIYNHI